MRGMPKKAFLFFDEKDDRYMINGNYWETEDYKKFTDKFKPKLTTDDCFTPPAVYEVVKDWAAERKRAVDDCKVR